MFVISQGQKKAKFIVKTINSRILSNQKNSPTLPIIKPKPFYLNQLPLTPQNIETKASVTVKNSPPKIQKKSRFKLSFIKEPHSTTVAKSKKTKENIIQISKVKQKRNNMPCVKYSCGRWKEDEHKRFIEAIIKFGNDWKQVQMYVKTRSSTQARSHAQKFFVKIKKAKILDFSLDLSKSSIKMFHDSIKAEGPEQQEKILSTLTSITFEKNPSKKKMRNEANNNNNYSNQNLISISENFEEYNKNINESFNNESNRDLNFIFNAFINHISNEELYGYEQLRQLSYPFDPNDNTYPEQFTRRKRSSVTSISGFFKGYIDDNDIKNLKINNESANAASSLTCPINFGSNCNSNNFGNYMGFEENKNFISEFASEDDYLLNYMKNNNVVENGDYQGSYLNKNM